MNVTAIRGHLEKLLNEEYGHTWAYHLIERHGPDGKRRWIRHISELTPEERRTLAAQYQFLGEYSLAEAKTLQDELERRRLKPGSVPKKEVDSGEGL